ncbi:MAG: DAK2 domain-containing protein [Eubacteriales bacterium]|nr:DAK2 domain-containing protein [Eubacteriales bacterium]
MKLIDSALFRSMVISGAANLSNQRKLVDDLNVFPVPDGDTGTNMNMTFSAAADALNKSDAATVTEIADIIANATIRGARGNSGVILSQLFRGISRSVKDKAEINAEDLANAFALGSATAYKAVMKPTEGTILTVSRESAEDAINVAKETDDVIAVMDALVKGAKVSLDNTPEVLPVLKQAGVVDSGGMGLYIIIEGFLLAMQGSPVVKLEQEAPQQSTSSAASAQAVISTEDIQFAYCTEFLINNPKKKAKKCKEALSRLGDSLVFVEDEDIIKVHVHTNNPGFALQEALKIGEISNIKIENMKLQHSAILFEQEGAPAKEDIPHKQFGIVSVATGEGIENLFTELGVDQLVAGGQSMNPGTDDILAACEKINADVIFVLPNNKNIIMAAQQAAEISQTEIIVIPTKSIPQGITAVLGFSPDISKEDNEASMLEMVASVKTCSVTFASRTTKFDDQDINEGDILGLTEGKLTIVGSDINVVAKDLVAENTPEDGQVITVYYGEDVTKEDAQALSDELEEIYGDCDVVCQYGGQPLYYYFIAIEG